MTTGGFFKKKATENVKFHTYFHDSYKFLIYKIFLILKIDRIKI